MGKVMWQDLENGFPVGDIQVRERTGDHFLAGPEDRNQVSGE
jgi:hypothetical protein